MIGGLEVLAKRLLKGCGIICIGHVSEIVINKGASGEPDDGGQARRIQTLKIQFFKTLVFDQINFSFPHRIGQPVVIKGVILLLSLQ